MRYYLYTLMWAALDWVFPPNCGGCDRPGTRWCSECNENTRKIPPPFCNTCGQPIANGEICLRCQKNPPNYDALRSWAIFGGPVRNSLHNLKYKGNLAMGEALSKPLSGLARQMNWGIDLVVPVPLGASRQEERGYNQASLLARPLAMQLNLNYRTNALFRVRETQSQVDLNLEQRKKNVSGAFRADSNSVAGKIILVIDDVTTSGSTLDSCAVALLSAGAGKVYGLTLARAENLSAQ